MTTQGPKNKGQCSSVGPAQPKRKRLPINTLKKRFSRAKSDSKCSACLSGLLTYIVPPCTPSPLTSRSQLSPPAPSPLATELIHAAAALLVAACECRCHRHPCTAPAAAASPYHRLRPVPSGARRRHCPGICLRPHKQ
jgi:hypothetical protein